ncbi:B2 bradykinin receptor-like [Sebastes umbrosus]|uniref:B2 bradykinin receptor-like n=1 Tax=Sebastes umbrosus TaxID=72105 RepID=UPI00189D6529|nr:B2 bradykinin receptor-like [Sebastes umbrosus]
MALLPTSVPSNFSTAAIYGDQNNTNGAAQQQCPDAEMKGWYFTVLPVYILLITVLGIVLNVFVLMVFCFHKKACTVAEIYLSNMAAADLVLMSCLPFWAVYVSNGFNWHFGVFLCKVVNMGINMNAYSSIYFLILVSVDRCVALVHPLSHGRMRRPKYAKLGCLLVWCFGLLLSVPTLVYRGVKHYPDYNITGCYLNYPNHTVQLVFDGILFVFGFIIPIFIISYCTLKIIQALNNRLMLNTQRTEQKATTLVLAVLLAFMICWVPFHVVKILEALLKAEVLSGCSITSILNTCKNIFMYLAFFNSVLNPILYVIVGENFRKKVRKVFKQWSTDRTTTLNTTFTRSKLLRSVKTVSS